MLHLSVFGNIFDPQIWSWGMVKPFQNLKCWCQNKVKERQRLMRGEKFILGRLWLVPAGLHCIEYFIIGGPSDIKCRHSRYQHPAYQNF